MLRLAFYYAASVFPLPFRRKLIYFRAYNRFPNLKDPQLFSEKINWRICFDRRDEISFTCDKVKMKNYVESLNIDVKIPRTIWQGRDLSTIPRIKDETHWILKPNHSSGAVIIGQGDLSSVDDLRSQTRGWLKNFNGDVLGEWAYSKADETLLLEELIGDGTTSLPDFKFYVFDGTVKLIHVDSDRHSEPRRRMYLPDWTPLPYRNAVPLAPPIEKPKRLREMIEIAQAIGEVYDFIRVDLYLHNDDIWFGEMTPYPAGGAKPYRPSNIDLQLGSYWNLGGKL